LKEETFLYASSYTQTIILLIVGIWFTTMSLDHMNSYHVENAKNIILSWFFYGVSFFMLAISIINFIFKLFLPKQYITVSEKGILFPGSLLKPKKKFIEYKYIYGIRRHRKSHITYLTVETFESDFTLAEGLFKSSDHFYRFIDKVNVFKSKYNKTLERNS